MKEPLWVQMIAIATAASYLTPILTALIIRWHWPSWLKAVIGLGLSGIAAFVGCAVLLPRVPGSVSEWATFVGAFITATQVAYKGFWKTIGIERLEAATTPGANAPRTGSAGF